MSTNWSDKTLIAAIDFGTTASGFALSYLSDYKNDKKIITHEWRLKHGTGYKTPTCVLLRKDKTFHSFGHEAETKYASLVDDNEHKDWYHFRRFKMKLYDDKKNIGLSHDDHIKDTNGHELPARHVFTHAIKYMKDQIVQAANDRFKIGEEHIYYVLTTPAIWSEAAKAFMRKAANDAHIPDDRLRIALEPECAAIYLHNTELSALVKQNRYVLEPGTRHVIIDLGGGTLDVSAHSVDADGKFIQIIAPRGGPHCGDNINKAFEQFLVDLSGVSTIESFKQECTEDFLHLQRDFEQQKCCFDDTDDSAKVTIRIPQSLQELHKTHNNADLENTVKLKHKRSIIITREKMKFESKAFKEFFQETIDEILRIVSSVLETIPEPISTISCVGGFANCHILRKAFRAKFQNQLLLIPPEPHIAVMKGAAIFGREYSFVKIRKSRYTIGLDWNEDFNHQVHPKEKLEKCEDGTDVCRDIFKKLIGKNDPIALNESAIEIEAYAKSIYQPNVEFPFYVSEILDDPKYITDVGCRLMGTLTVDIENRDHQRSECACLRLKVFFGDTELKASATDETGKTYTVTFRL